MSLPQIMGPGLTPPVHHGTISHGSEDAIPSHNARERSPLCSSVSPVVPEFDPDFDRLLPGKLPDQIHLRLAVGLTVGPQYFVEPHRRLVVNVGMIP